MTPTPTIDGILTEADLDGLSDVLTLLVDRTDYSIDAARRLAALQLSLILLSLDGRRLDLAAEAGVRSVVDAPTCGKCAWQAL